MKKMKLYSCSFSLVLLILAIYSSLGIEFGVDNLKNELKPDSTSVSNFIELYLTDFVKEYNKASQEDTWNATKVEYKANVYDIKENETYVYLDFNDNEGYALVGNDYNFLDFSTTGDMDYLRKSSTLLWNCYDGFVKYEDGYLVSYKLENQVASKEDAYNGAGQARGFNFGIDGIINIEEYMEAYYGKGWYYDEGSSRSLENYEDVYQEDYSIYGYYEGNCTLAAYYGIFKYLRDYSGWDQLPSTYTYTDISKDASFNEGLEVVRYWLPTIYSSLRDHAMQYEYTTASTLYTSTNMEAWGNQTLYDFGMESEEGLNYAHFILLHSFYRDVVDSIDAGCPAMWNQGVLNYKNHSLVVKGYKVYKKDHKIWFIKWTSTKNLMEMSDNYRYTGRTTYIDYDGFMESGLTQGLATMVVVKTYLW